MVAPRRQYLPTPTEQVDLDAHTSTRLLRAVEGQTHHRCNNPKAHKPHPSVCQQAIGMVRREFTNSADKPANKHQQVPERLDYEFHVAGTDSFNSQ